MRYSVIIILTFITFIASAQKKEVEVYHETQEDGSLKIFARNNTEFLQSVQIEATFKGMEASEDLPILKTIEPNQSAYYFSLTPVKNAYSYNYRFTYIKGDVTAEHNDDIIYYLPYAQSKSYIVDQSYNETPTHMNQYALDFHMDEGTEITAIRAGVVFEVVDSNNKGCPREDCSKFNNYVLVMHDDGSIADYSHLQKNGARVEVGDTITSGDLIGLSGSTGYASGPHLHLEVYVMRFSGQQSIRAEYYLDKSTIGVPMSNHRYTQEMDKKNPD